MSLRNRVGTTLAIAATVTLVSLVACNDTPVEASARATDAPEINLASIQPKKPKTLHYARVNGDGTLVDGTAISATRSSEGRYHIIFPPPIGNCAATATSSAFVGFDGSVFRISSQTSIGFSAGGAFDDETVTVSLFSTSDGAAEDTSFSLILICP